MFMAVSCGIDLDADQLHFVSSHDPDGGRKTFWTPQAMSVYRNTLLTAICASDCDRNLFNIQRRTLTDSPLGC